MVYAVIGFDVADPIASILLKREAIRHREQAGHSVKNPDSSRVSANTSDQCFVKYLYLFLHKLYSMRLRAEQRAE